MEDEWRLHVLGGEWWSGCVCLCECDGGCEWLVGWLAPALVENGVRTHNKYMEMEIELGANTDRRTDTRCCQCGGDVAELFLFLFL